MSSLQGLPPLPRSLSGFNLNGAGLVMEPATPPPPPPARSSSKASQRGPKTPTSTTSLSSGGSRPSPSGRQLTTLDTQLAILRREMVSEDAWDFGCVDIGRDWIIEDVKEKNLIYFAN